MNPKTAKVSTILMGLLVMSLTVFFSRGATARPADSANPTEEAAIKQVVAGFSDGWNSHD